MPQSPSSPNMGQSPSGVSLMQVCFLPSLVFTSVSADKIRCFSSDSAIDR